MAIPPVDIEMGVILGDPSELPNPTPGPVNGPETLQTPEPNQEPVQSEITRPESIQTLVNQETVVNHRSRLNYCSEVILNKYTIGFVSLVLLVGISGVVIYFGVHEVLAQEAAAVLVKATIPCFFNIRSKSNLKSWLSIIFLGVITFLYAYLVPGHIPLFLIIKLSLQVVKVLYNLVRLEKIYNSSVANTIKNWKYFKLIVKCFVWVRNRFAAPLFQKFLLNGVKFSSAMVVALTGGDSGSSIWVSPAMRDNPDGTYR